MSENKKFRIQNGVDIRGEMSFGDQVVVDDSLNITGKTITADTFEGDGSNLTGVVKPSDLNTLIDSDYIQERVVLDGVGIDSADAQLLIDVEKNRAQSAEQVNATAIQSNTNAIDAERQARIEGDQLAVNGRTVQFATLEAMISAEETRATVAEAGLSQDIVDSTSLSLSGDSDLQSQINSIKAGDTEFTGDLIPDQDNVHSLGSETKMWKDVYVGPGSLYINGQKVIEDNSGTITVNADPGQNLSLNTSGGGAIDLNSGDESVQIRSDLIISSSKTISTAGGAATKFGGDVDMQSNQIGNLGTPLQSTDAATKQYVDSVIAVPHTGTKTFDDDVVIGGTLTVKGSTTTIESETLSVADNMVDLNSNMTSGTPTENAGIRVLRGDESPKSFLWKESQGTWSAEGPITATTYYGDGSNLVGIDVYTDADVTALVDSDYVQSRVVIPEPGVDSAEVISMIPTQIEAYNGANNVHFSGTNVGVGRSSNSVVRLSVAGSDAGSNDYAFEATDNALGTKFIVRNDGQSQFFNRYNSSSLTITNTGNVGIGTTAPDGIFHIKSSAVHRSRFESSSSHSMIRVIAGTGSNAGVEFYSGTGNVGNITADSSSNLLFEPGGSEAMRIDASGNVGIGTTSPDESLVVNGGVKIRGTNKLSFTNTSDQTFIHAASSNVLAFNTNSTERMRIDSSGQVKIANGGLLNFDAASNGNFDIAYKASDNTFNIINNSSSAAMGFHTSSTERMRIDASGNFMVGATSAFDSSSFCVDQSGLGQFRRDGTPLIIRRDGAYGTLIDFEQDGATVGSITSDAGSVGIGSGNVGLMFYDGGDRIIPRNGTSTSDAAIDLGFSTDRFKDLYLSGNIHMAEDQQGIVWERNTDGASIKFYNTGDGDGDSRLEFNINDNTNEDFRWTATSGGVVTELARMSPDGGANGFTYHGNTVVHSGNISDYATNGYADPANGQAITLRTSIGNERGSISAHEGTSNLRISTSNGESIAFYDGTTENVRINGSGDVELFNGSIGVSASQSVRFNGTGDISHSVGYDSTIDGSFMRGQNGMRFLTSTGGGVERMRIDSAGRVGIGTSSPNTSFKLEVSGEIPAIFTATSAVASSMYGGVVAHRNTNTVGNGTGIGFQLEDAGNVDTEYAYIGGIIEANTSGSEKGGMIFATTINNTRVERMRLNASGNVGIGTNSPSYPLTVSGKISYSGAIGEGADNTLSSSSTTLILGESSTWQNLSLRTAGTERVRIDSSGNMSVTGTITESSSITYKENVDPITNALELVTQLVGVTYDRKDGSAKDRAGLIAEQVNEVLPNVVKKNEEGGAEAIAYTNLIAYLIESVKELKSEIDELRGK